MEELLINLMVYGGSALMAYNIYSYVMFARHVRARGDWANETRLFYIPVALLVLFLTGYLAVGLFGHPDLVVGGILFGGSIFVLVMLLFSLFGSVFGMSEETIAFALIIIPLAVSMGYDSIVGLCMVYVAAHIGFSGAMLNPFTIGIAQGIAEIPLFTGIGYRAVCWAILTVVGIVFVLWYASKVKKNPQSSIMYEEDAYWRKMAAAPEEEMQHYTPRKAWWVFAFLTIVLVMG